MPTRMLSCNGKLRLMLHSSLASVGRILWGWKSQSRLLWGGEICLDCLGIMHKHQELVVARLIAIQLLGMQQVDHLCKAGDQTTSLEMKRRRSKRLALLRQVASAATSIWLAHRSEGHQQRQYQRRLQAMQVVAAFKWDAHSDRGHNL